MGMTNNKGFTIIETMLFLAITGVLIAGMIVGVGSSVTIQRYRDSVSTLKAFIQDQYSQLTNISNSHDSSWRCDPSTGETVQSGSTQPRGQSDCLVLGRYIMISGGDQTTATVIGYDKNTGTGTDINILKTGYVLGLSKIDQESSVMEWGSEIAWPSSTLPKSGAIVEAVKTPTTPRSIGILMIRSPDSGLVYTFTTDTPVDAASVTDVFLQSMLVTGLGTSGTPAQQHRLLCVEPGGITLTTKMGIYIHEYATNESGIEVRSNDVLNSLGVITQC